MPEEGDIKKGEWSLEMNKFLSYPCSQHFNWKRQKLGDKSWKTKALLRTAREKYGVIDEVQSWRGGG